MKNLKSTDQLKNEIINSEDIHESINENKDEFIDENFNKLLMNLIISKNLKHKDIIKNGNLNRTYFYHLISGKRNPSRNKIIQIAFGMKLDLNETQILLKSSKMKELYSKIKRDAIIIYAISKKMTIVESDVLLDEEGEEPIC